MQQQDYFIVVLAHSLHGRLRRIQIPQKTIHKTLLWTGLAVLLIGVSMFGFLSSYARMAWKVANYNALRRETDALRARYENLQKVVAQTDSQLASLQLFANELSVAYGIKQKLEGPADIAAEARLVPTFAESLEEYTMLRSVAGLRRNTGQRWHVNVQPTIWPVAGRLEGPYGQRIDPFSGEGAFHRGVDISAPTGTAVRATADGVVLCAERFSGYGRLVVVDHGGGIHTYYAHLSRYHVMPGQELRRGETVGEVGTSGRVTAPHLHYEVRIGGAPVNPYRHMKAAAQPAVRRDLLF